MGLHHFYLGRHRQGLLWLTSFAGIFGLGEGQGRSCGTVRLLFACLFVYSAWIPFSPCLAMDTIPYELVGYSIYGLALALVSICVDRYTKIPTG